VPVKEVLPMEVRPVAIAPRVNPVEAAITAVEDGRSMIATAVKRDTASVETATPVPTTATMPNLVRQTAGC